MKVLLISCFLYLLGMVVVLYFKPKLMFDDKGNWKEFGFVLNNTHTWFPLWLFCILWSILSYAIISSIFNNTISNTISNTITNVAKKEMIEKAVLEASPSEMKTGYYALDKNTTKKTGFPKYIYLGTELPEE